MPHSTNRALQARYLWLFAFCFATTTALLFTKILLPMLPSLHGGSGLLKNDAVFFQQAALLLADNIRTHGWSIWSIWSTETHTTGNVAILSALYALFDSTDPALIIPINALFQASSAYLLLLIGREIWPGRTGNLAGLIAGSLFVISPSALSWYSQPLKDSYVIAGALLVLYSLLKLGQPLSIRHGAKHLIWLVIGIFLTVFVKPYYIKPILVITAIITLIAITSAFWTHSPRRYRTLLIYLIATSLTLGVYTWMPQTNLDGMQYEQYSAKPSTLSTQQQHQQTTVWSWQNTPYIPDSIEKYLATAAKTRIGMIEYNQSVNAHTLIDANHTPNSVATIIAYLPRALQIGLFAPFPNTWLQKFSLPKLGVIAETFIWYVIAPGILLALLYRRSIQLTITLVFALFFVTTFSFVGPNVGTLYRARYAYEFLLILIGIAGWITYLARQFTQNNTLRDSDPTITAEPTLEPTTITSCDGKKTLIRSAMVVSALSLVGSLGFFARDFLMTRWFGIGSEMDSFILGSMIPMLLVAVFSIPAGAAIIPVYTSQHHKNPEHANHLLISAIFALSTLLAGLAVIFYVFLPQLFTLLNWHYTPTELSAIRDIADIYLLLLWLSGLVILANSVLTAVGKTVFPSLAQLVVPLVAFATLALFGTRYGIYPVAYAMLIGQSINLVLITYALHRNNLLPKRISNPFTMLNKLPIRQYTFLMVTAFSSALLIPITNSMAATLTIGSVAIIGLGTKVILLITGVISIGINTVLLPYFSKLVAKLQHSQAQSDFAFFLLLLTLLSIPATLLLTFLVEPIVSIMFAHSKLTEQDLINLTKVIEYGVIQLPFFACALVATKYITAYQRSGIIMISAFFGLIFIIVAGSALSKAIGVAGISLAMTLAAALSAMILVLYTNHLRHLSISDSLFIGFNWMMFLTLFLFLHYQLYAGLMITLIAYMILVVGHWQALINEWQEDNLTT